MQGIKSLKDIPTPPDNCAVAIGNFDGIHQGHRKILNALIQEAKNDNLYPLLLTFHPHPAKILAERKIELIQTIEQRLNEIKKFGVQMTVVLSFDSSFAHTSSEEFIRTIILKKLRAKKRRPNRKSGSLPVRKKSCSNIFCFFRVPWWWCF